MKWPRRVTRFAALIAAIFIIFQSFAFTAFAAWTGNTWQGQQWEGKSWNGTPWEGQEWSGNTWEGQEWQDSEPGEQKEWEGPPWDGTQWSSLPWYLQSSANGQSWTGNNWTGNGINGNGWNGTPFNGNGVNGNSWSSNPFSGNGFTGNGPFNGQYGGIPGINGAPFNQGGAQHAANPSDSSHKGPDGYKVTKYVVDTVINGQVKMVADAVKDGDAFNKNFLTRPNYLTRVAASGFKLGFDGALPADLILTGHDGTDKFYKVKDNLDKLRKFSQERAAAANVGNLAPAAGEVLREAAKVTKMTPLSKLNVATAGLSAGFAAVDTYKAYQSFKSAKTGTQKGEAVGGMIASTGDFLMNAGTMTAAFPGAQAVGAGIIVAGGILWGIGTATKLISRHWNKITGAARKFVSWRENTKKKIIGGGVKLLKAGFNALFSR